MPAASPAPIDRTSRALAERLDLALAPYASDAALMTVLLDALVRRGYSPSIMYERNPHGDRWVCTIRRDGEQRTYPSMDADITRAVVGAAVSVLQLELWRR